jgi:sigma-B regulation protein RsbU (phosphoserine phosphatase)
MPDGREPPMTTDFEAELSELQALTDTTLARLGIDDLLDELLDRVRDILDADTAAVLLVTEGSDELEARAARGIEAEVRQGVRVPLGTGFAGRIASTRLPILLERVDATTVANPILWEQGIKVMLGVPLLTGDRLVGVLHVGRLADRPFDARDAELLGVVAARVATAVHARQFVTEQEAALLLERSLLPARPPNWPGLEIAARYVSAESRSVGGDWYDLFQLPSGEHWVVIGDIAGHGLGAAVVMGRIRSALRAYALLDIPPEKVLELVDQKMQHFELGTVATVAVAVTRAPFDTVRIATAGHPPPILAAPGEAPVLLPITPEPLLGAGFEGRRSSSEFTFPPGALMAMYTDGLVERRGEALDAGLERLRVIVSPESPHTLNGMIMRSLIGDASPADDIALVLVRRTTE